MGNVFGLPSVKLPSVPKLGGGKGKKKVTKKKVTKKKVTEKKGRVGRYEEEPEEFANWAMTMSPAAYEAVAARPKLASRRTSPYEDEPEEYETDDEEYETDDEEGYMARHQEYTPADFSSVATPMNFSVLLMVLLFLILVLSRR